MFGAVTNRPYRAWGKYRITDLFYERVVIDRGSWSYGTRSVPTTIMVTAHGVSLLLLWLRHTECAYYYYGYGTRSVPTTIKSTIIEGCS